MSKRNENDFYQVNELLEMFDTSRKNFYSPLVFTDESYKKFVDSMIYLLRFTSEKFVFKYKIEEKIEEFKNLKKEILRIEKQTKHKSITYDIVRNDYCEKMLEGLLKGDDK